MTSRLTDGTFRDYIIGLLEKKPELRESDNHLIATVWYKEARAKGLDLEKLSAFEFLKMVKAGDFTTTESIQRARRKAQEEHPHLRGPNYKGRQVKEGEVRDYYREA